MKAKDGMEVLLNFALSRKRLISLLRLFGAVGNSPFVLPVFGLAASSMRVSTRAAAYLAAVMLICGGFCVPAIAVPTLDLTTSGSDGNIGLAYFVQIDAQSTGTGVIEPFVRLSTNQAISEGYNTDARPLELDENNSPQFTRSLLLTDVPIVDMGGTLYREFMLDINQKGTVSGSLLSLDTMEIYLADAGNLTGYPGGLGTLIYDMDVGGDEWILLDYKLNHGSGSGDMLAYIPDSLFVGGDYVYLYSIFGENYASNAGFEEWAIRIGEPLPVIPSPASIMLGSIGIGLVGWLRRSRTL
ncbi:MAG: hypothetical protein CEE38_05655 [Planctomycetes bacterium B3_Pla]|nr:MAG: hypothetical protein CEE38_05655 [Planctomycetes bacterium B3_Pla]